jgi:inosine-uridine nucleoside N-ribohydrolase
MKLPILLATCLTLFFCTTAALAQAPVIAPVNIIFDTDMGNDVDDALALAMLHALQSRHEVHLLAVTTTKDNKWVAPYVDLVNTFYGHPEIPIGTVRNGKTPESNPMIQLPSERRRRDGTFVYPHRIVDGAAAPDAVSLLRKSLAGQPDGSVVIVQVGFSTNLARLLDTKPDAASPQDGHTLVSRKVRLLSVMAGNFANGQSEFNLAQDVPSAVKLFHEWPSPIVVSGFEIGAAIPIPAPRIEHDFAYIQDHPVADAYRAYMKMPYDRPAWDLTAVLYAVRPDEGYFSLSPPGIITVSTDGGSRFSTSAGGNRRHLVLTQEQRARTLEAMILLASQPPSGGAAPH